MLFILTGDIQIGKTRWLERLVDDLEAEGVFCLGVISPGIWRVTADPGGDAGRVNYEKLGIETLLLPGRARSVFALRRDIAEREGGVDGQWQSSRATLGWAIPDEALDVVNKHFERLSAPDASDANAEQSDAPRPLRSSSRHCERLSAPDASDANAEQSDTPGQFRSSSRHCERPQGARQSIAAACVHGLPRAGCAVARNDGQGANRNPGQAPPGLLVVDELGRLELNEEEPGGFTAAVRLLEQGPTPRYQHALVVARADLAETVRSRFTTAWGTAQTIPPTEQARHQLATTLGVTLM